MNIGKDDELRQSKVTLRDEEVEEVDEETLEMDDEDDSDDEDEKVTPDEESLSDNKDEENEDEDEVEESTSVSSPPIAGYPFLIHCAQARGDEAMAETYRTTYGLAKEQEIEEGAKEVIIKIEQAITSGDIFKGAVEMGTISEEVFAKLADLLEGEVEDEKLIVRPQEVESEDVLILEQSGRVRIGEE